MKTLAILLCLCAGPGFGDYREDFIQVRYGISLTSSSYFSEIADVLGVKSSTASINEPYEYWLSDLRGDYRLIDIIQAWAKLMKESVEAVKAKEDCIRAPEDAFKSDKEPIRLPDPKGWKEYPTHPALQKLMHDYDKQECLEKQEAYTEYRECLEYKACPGPGGKPGKMACYAFNVYCEEPNQAELDKMCP